MDGVGELDLQKAAWRALAENKVPSPQSATTASALGTCKGPVNTLYMYKPTTIYRHKTPYSVQAHCLYDGGPAATVPLVGS